MTRSATALFLEEFLLKQNQLKQSLDQTRAKIDTLREKKLDAAFQAATRAVNPCELARIPNISSRAYFKMYEMLKRYPLLDKNTKYNLKALFLCEAPGGFVEAALDFVQPRGIDWYGVTLPLSTGGLEWKSDDRHVIYADVITDQLPHIARESMLATGDGGFEIDNKSRNDQEVQNTPLFKAQLLQGMAHLSVNGSLVVKFFDMFTMETCELLWHVFVNFDKVFIIKPYGSRTCNSEKYVVALGFTNKHRTMEKTGIDAIVPDWFMGRIFEVSQRFTEAQIKYLEQAIDLASRLTVQQIHAQFNAKQQKTAASYLDFLFKKKYLHQAHDFYEKHGGITIIVARFMPFLRTFAPFVAGVAEMTRSKFTAFNVIGALIWVLGIVTAGYFLGGLPWVKANLDKIIWAMIVLPGLIAIGGAWWSGRRKPATQG